MAEYDGFDARRAFGRFRTAAGLGKPAGTLRRWAVAATGIAAAVVVAAGIAFLTRPAPSERERTLQLADAIYPAPDKVTLTLADGRRLQLDGQAERTDRRRGPRQLRHRRREIRSGARDRRKGPERRRSTTSCRSPTEANASSRWKTAPAYGSTPARRSATR